ncbi:MAG: response regulator transcription factor [Clostridiales bacterium]|jgi:two-component system alkaline phosphatase synthesis response regulator PhoP|nr:response regulator transcription factor [Clostridiales bacterium]
MNRLIYSVEDDESIGELIKYSLTNAGYEVDLFTNAEDMFDALQKRQPSLILMDIMLPGADGIEAIKKIREKYQNVNIKIILLTAKNSEINKISGLNDGADDYVTKPFSILELIARIKAHLRKYTTDISDGDLTFADIKLNTNSREVAVSGSRVDLTYKEFELLRALMENAGVVLDREKLIKDIWGFEYFGESRTVDIHIKNLRAKLGAAGERITSVRGVGYILRGDER